MGKILSGSSKWPCPPGRDSHCILTAELNSSAVLISEVLPSASSGTCDFIDTLGAPLHRGEGRCLGAD